MELPPPYLFVQVIGNHYDMIDLSSAFHFWEMTSVEYSDFNLLYAAIPRMQERDGEDQREEMAESNDKRSLGVTRIPIAASPCPMISVKPPWSGAIIGLPYLAASRIVIGKPSYHRLAMTKKRAFR